MLLNQGFLNKGQKANIFKATYEVADNTAVYFPAYGIVDYLINWGDNTEETVKSGAAAGQTHTYANAGQYQISVIGTFQELNYFKASEKQLISIDAWGEPEFSSLSFKACSNLNRLPDAPIPGERLTSLESLFQETIITNVSSNLFARCSSVTNINNLFALGQLQQIPSGLFDSMPDIKFAYWVFAECFITAIPEGLFFNNKKIEYYLGCFSSMRTSFQIEGDLFDLSALSIVKSFSQFMEGTRTAQGTIQPIWEHSTPNTNQLAFRNQTDLTNYADIPEGWK